MCNALPFCETTNLKKYAQENLNFLFLNLIKYDLLRFILYTNTTMHGICNINLLSR